MWNNGGDMNYFLIFCKHCKEKMKISTNKSFPSGAKECPYCHKKFNITVENVLHRL